MSKTELQILPHPNLFFFLVLYLSKWYLRPSSCSTQNTRWKTVPLLLFPALIPIPKQMPSPNIPLLFLNSTHCSPTFCYFSPGPGHSQLFITRLLNSFPVIHPIVPHYILFFF